MTKTLVIIGACAWFCASGQTLIDLKTQGRDVDFSTAPFTRPVKVGSGLPASCGLGDLYFRSDAIPGSNLFGCTAANTWSQMSTSSAGTSYSAGLGMMLAGSAFTTDFSVVPGLALSNTWSNLNDFSMGKIRVQTGAGVPPSAACAAPANVGSLYVRSDTQAPNASHYVCAQTGAGVYSWELTQAGWTGGGTQSMSSPLTTRGDLWAFSAVNARLPVGSDGQVLTADSTQALGLKWAAPAGGGSNTVTEELLFPMLAFANGNVYSAPGVITSLGVSGAALSHGLLMPNSGSPSLVIQTYLHKNWTGSIDLKAYGWQGDGGGGTWQLAIQTACIGVGSSSSPTFNDPQNTTATDMTGSNSIKAVTLSGVTTTGCNAGDLFYVQITRNNSPTSGSNYVSNVILPSVVLTESHN